MEKLCILMDMYISSDAVRRRFKGYLGSYVTDDEMVSIDSFKDELRSFAAEFPECMSKIRDGIL